MTTTASLPPRVTDTLHAQRMGATIPCSGEGSTVHANVVFVNVDAAQDDPARRGLHEQVIPRVRQTAGFVAGYWLEPIDGRGISMTLWETEQAAREAAYAAADLITFEGQQLRRDIALRAVERMA